jgi:hypothetical protein
MGIATFVLVSSIGKPTRQETITAFVVILITTIGTLNMRSLLTFLCLLVIVSPLQANDEEMSRLLVGTWRTSFDQPLYNNSIAKVQMTVT